MYGGRASVGASHVDFKNFKRDLNMLIGDSDVQIVINGFQTKMDANVEFFYSYEADTEGKLTRLFWCDRQSLLNYKRYGDNMSVDSTYDTNKY